MEKQTNNSNSNVLNSRKRNGNNDSFKTQISNPPELTKLNNTSVKNMQQGATRDQIEKSSPADKKQQNPSADRTADRSSVTSRDRLSSFETTVDLITRRCVRPFFANELNYHVLNESNELNTDDVINCVTNDVINFPTDDVRKQECVETRVKQEVCENEQRRDFTIDNLLN